MSAPANSPYRVSLRLYVVFSLLMAVSAALSGLFLLYLARPFARQLSSEQSRELTMLLFTGSAVAGALAAVGGLIVGLNFAGRIRGIVEKAEALSPHPDGAGGRRATTVRDELGALDAAVGRLTLSMDRFVRDSDILARLPEGMLLLDPGGTLVSFNATAETLLDLPLERFRGEAILSDIGAFPLARGNAPLARLLEDDVTGIEPVHDNEVAGERPRASRFSSKSPPSAATGGGRPPLRCSCFVTPRRSGASARRSAGPISSPSWAAWPRASPTRSAPPSPPSAASSSCSRLIWPRAMPGASTSIACSSASIGRIASWKTSSPSRIPSRRCGRRWPCRRRWSRWWPCAPAIRGSSWSVATRTPSLPCGAIPSGSPRCSAT